VPSGHEEQVGIVVVVALADVVVKAALVVDVGTVVVVVEDVVDEVTGLSSQA
jgi:hypothetical protein